MHSWSRSGTASIGARSWTGSAFTGRSQPLSGSGVRATYFPDGGEGLLVVETDARASVADAAMQDVTARLLAERFERSRCGARRRGGPSTPCGEPAEPPAPGADPPAWYS